MAEVDLTPEADEERRKLPRPIRERLADVIVRLERWPRVSGAKPLKRELKGNWRIRTGDYRIVFRVSADDEVVTIWKIGYRGDVYD